MKTVCALILAGVAALFSASALAEERILEYLSDISVQEDGSMLVQETIRVRAEGRSIRRGIYRDFPTTYKDRLGNNYRVGFDLLEVSRDGRPEDHHTKSLQNGVRIYIGNKNRHLTNGIYTYEIVYRTNRQLGFFDKHDELYWNVTGNDWAFAIDRASASVSLPPGVPPDVIVTQAYTGPYGSKGGNYVSEIGDDGVVHFETTRSLGHREGLTIVVGWPKGHVQEPAAADNLGYLLRDNRHLVAGLFGMLVLLGFYFVIWRLLGRDPAAGVIIPRYKPPEGFSPAAMRFIRRMGYDDKTFVTALVNMAVSGLITIQENAGNYTLIKNGDIQGISLAPGERQLFNKLFAKGRHLTLEQTNHSTISKALKAHEASLERNYEKLYFATNSGWVVIGVLITLATSAAAVSVVPVKEPLPAVLFLLFWITVWTLAVIGLGQKAFNAWRRVSSVTDLPGVFPYTLMFAVFMFFECMALWFLSQLAAVGIVVVPLSLAAVNFLFYHLLKAPTRAGRRLLDKLDGFRLYLDVAESEALDFSHPPEKTPSLFEQYMPYALALDLEQQWGEQFTQVFAETRTQQAGYSPRWYRGSSWRPDNLSGFTSSLGASMSSAVSSSSTAPGSSSGGGGGGSSGGGGGGGGGGGW